jgi:hypothetical protein
MSIRVFGWNWEAGEDKGSDGTDATIGEDKVVEV